MISLLCLFFAFQQICIVYNNQFHSYLFHFIILFINLQRIKMQEELHRIRNKDYTHIDEKLYNNLGMTAQLDSTLTQLAELQKYLKSQIDSISDQSQKQAALKASRVLLMAPMPIQEKSYMKCKCSRVLEQLYQKITKIKKSFKFMKQSISRESKDCINDIKDLINQNVTYLANLSMRKQNETSKLKTQIFSLQEEVNDLKHKNSELIMRLDQWEIAKKRRRDKMSQFTDKRNGSPVSIYLNTDNQLSSREAYQLFEEQNTLKSDFSFKKDINTKHCSSLNTLDDGYNEGYQVPMLPMPLRRQNSIKSIQRPNSIDRYSSCQTIKQKKLAQQNQFQTAKNSPKNTKVQWQNEKSATNPRQKQNEMLRLKGAQSKQYRKNSTKKLKLFCII